MNAMERVLATLVRLVVLAAGAVFVVLGAALVLVLLLIATVWALVRGKRPGQPVFVGQFGRFARGQMGARWSTGPAGQSSAAPKGDVIDAEVTDVTDKAGRLGDGSRR